MKLASILFLAIFFAALTACSGSGILPPNAAAAEMVKSDKPRAAATVPSENLLDVASGNRAFALDLYRALAEKQGNLFYSPYSISLALAMTYAGARGQTEQQMAKTLHYGLPQERLHSALNALDRTLASRGQGAKGKDEKGFRLKITNAVWGQQGYKFLPDYLSVLAENYDTGVRLVDFAAAPEPSRKLINDWVQKQTEDRIKDLVPEGAITALTRLVLTNAIYFNAAWFKQFEKSATADGPFTTADGKQVTVPMMHQSGSMAYAEGAGYQAVELPYDGGQLGMAVLLPASGQFAPFEKTLDAARVDEIVGALEGKQVDLTLPRFKYESSFSLKSALTALGMKTAFIPDEADLSGIDGKRDLFISEVLHKAFVSVDEAGTEAAAATAVIVATTSAPAEPVTFKADRPFIFLIRDLETGTILFVGRVVDPSQ